MIRHVGEMTGTVEAVEAIEMLDASSPGDLPGGHFIPGGIRVLVRTRAGTFPVAWRGPQPLVGDRVVVAVRTPDEELTAR